MLKDILEQRGQPAEKGWPRGTFVKKRVQILFQVTARDIFTKIVIDKHAPLTSKLVVQDHVESRRGTPTRGSGLDFGLIVDFIGELTDLR